MWQWGGLSGVVKMQFLVPRELHGTLGQHLAMEGEADEAPLRLSTMAQLLQRTEETNDLATENGGK
jgi:hypothetical protein